MCDLSLCVCVCVRVFIYVCAACLSLLSYLIVARKEAKGYINSIPSSNEKKESKEDNLDQSIKGGRDSLQSTMTS